MAEVPPFSELIAATTRTASRSTGCPVTARAG
jgi:hypothetical protein